MMREQLPFPIEHTFNQKLYRYRKGEHMSQDALVDLLYDASGGSTKLEQPHISKIENGDSERQGIIKPRAFRLLVATVFCVPENTDLYSAFVNLTTLTIPIEDVMRKYFPKES